METKICRMCGLEKPLNDFAINGRGKDGHHSNCKLCMKIKLQNRYQEQKEYIIKMLGGKCMRCGYDKCTEALDLHHKDPSVKEFTLSQRWTCKLEDLIKEASKCELLCANCHREEHFKLKNGPLV